MRRRAIVTCLAFLSVAALVLPAGASTKGESKRPVITRVTPMHIGVGSRLVIRGRNFSSRRRGNMVIFRGPGGRFAFVKPLRASRSKLVLTVPTSVARLLPTGSRAREATRMKLRILASRKFSAWTRKRLSPVVVPGG
jgi:hypothetical protein